MAKKETRYAASQTEAGKKMRDREMAQQESIAEHQYAKRIEREARKAASTASRKYAGSWGRRLISKTFHATKGHRFPIGEAST